MLHGHHVHVAFHKICLIRLKQLPHSKLSITQNIQNIAYILLHFTEKWHIMSDVYLMKYINTQCYMDTISISISLNSQ